MAALDQTIRTWDGLKLRVRTWAGGTRTPLLCLPGIIRTAEDYDDLAARHPDRRVVSLDYPGRGHSDYASSPARYRPEDTLRDVLDICAAVHLDRAIVIGTSFGGLLAMGLAAARPSLVAAAVLNDIGPEVGTEGGAFVRAFIAEDPALPDLQAAATHLRAKLPFLSLTTDAHWQRFATLTYAPGPDGLWHPLWDTRLATLLNSAPPNLWPLFGTLANRPLLLVHGAISTLLLPGTVSRMQQAHPSMTVVTVPACGHAPTLAEPEAERALDLFLAQL